MLLRICLLVSLTFAAYSFMLSSPFKTMDDQFSIVANPLIKNTRQWPQLFTQGYFNDRSYYRPLANLSFMAEYKLFGLRPFFYNCDNMLLHTANVFLVWILVALLINAETGFWVALLFAIHPLQWEAVANISGRAILLSSFFSLLAFIAYLKEQRLLALLGFAVALLCKESAAILPGVLVLHALLNRKSLRWVWAWAAMITVYLWLRHQLGITETFPWRNASERVFGFLTFLRSALIDLRLFIFPIDLHFDRSLQLFSSFAENGVRCTIVVWLLFLAWLAVARKSIKPLYWLCLGWFALELLPVSQIITTIGVQPWRISMAEHFLYMAAVPAFIILVKMAGRVGNYLKSREFLSIHALRAIIFSVFVFLFFMTVEQNIYAKNEETMLQRSLTIQPHNARLQASIGFINALRGDFAVAEGHFRNAVAGDPANARYRISLAQSLCDQKKWVPCLGQLEVINDPGVYGALLQRNSRVAFEHIQEELAAGRTLDERGWLILGNYYAKKGQMDEAIAAYGKVLVFNPTNADALFNLASLYEAKQEWRPAEARYQQLLSLPAAAVEESLRRHAKSHLRIIPPSEGQKDHVDIHTQ